MMDETTRLSESPAGGHVSAGHAHEPLVTPCGQPRPPRTELGRKLHEIRRRIVAAGQPMLDWDGFDREMQERRGESQPEA